MLKSEIQIFKSCEFPNNASDDSVDISGLPIKN